MRTGWKPSLTMSSSSVPSVLSVPLSRPGAWRARRRPSLRPTWRGDAWVRTTSLKEGGEQFVGALGRPGAGRARIEPVQQVRAPGPSALLDLFDDQLRVFEHSQVLANRVVVEAKERGELGDIYRAPGLCDVTENPMARWVTGSPGLLVQPVGRWSARALLSGVRYRSDCSSIDLK